jgi:DNA-binding transcriptional MerR regulator
MAEYKIRDLEVLSGIKAHTIRIWEKRYDLFSPERTDTQIRSYSDDDLTRCINISILNRCGFKISKIATMTDRELHDNVMECNGKNAEDVAVERLIVAMIEMDERLFHDTLNDLIQSVGLTLTFTDKLIPFLDRIGIMWLVGSINPAQEHFMSNLIRQKVISETDRLPIPQKKTVDALLFLPEHEQHEISLLFYNFMLRDKGFSTVYLGQSVPYDALKSCIEQLAPRTMVTAWLTAVDDNFMHSYFKRLANECVKIPVLAGGIQVNNRKDLVKDFIHEINDLPKQIEAMIS